MVTRVSALCVAVLFAACAAGRMPSATDGVADSTSGFSNGGRCPRSSDPGLPVTAGCVTSVVAGGERLSVYALVDRNSRPTSWRLRLWFAGRNIDRHLRTGSGYNYPRAIGGSDVDGDGDQDWWLKVVDYAGHGAPWAGLNLFIREGESLTPLSFKTAPLPINLGGTSRLGEGARCSGRDLVLLRAEAKDRQNTRWSVLQRRFSLRGHSARLVDRRQDSLEIENYNDPKLDRYFRVQCRGATFTPFG